MTSKINDSPLPFSSLENWIGGGLSFELGNDRYLKSPNALEISIFGQKKAPQPWYPLYQNCGASLRNDRENNTIRGFRFLVELSFGIWCSWVQSGCKTRRIWCTHSFRFAVISERTMARGRKKKFSDYIRTEVARIYRLLHNVGTLRRVPIFHFGCIFIGLTFLCP